MVALHSDTLARIRSVGGLPWAVLITGAAALSYPKVVGQWEFCLLLLVSLWSMVWFGQLAVRLLGAEDGLDDTFFFKAYIGQLALLMAWLLVSPVVYAMQVWMSLPFAGSLLVALLVVTTVWWSPGARREFFASMRRRDAIGLALLIIGSAGLFKAASYYSYNAGALGLDTYQHIAFSIDILNSGYPRFEAGSTGIIEAYPKLLHIITALWAWPGFGDHVGPFLKVQPALQTLLVVMSFIELLWLWLVRQESRQQLEWYWCAAVAIMFAYILFRGSEFLYPIVDLNSTGRLSAASTLLLPLIVGIAMQLAPSARVAAFAWASLPLSAALCVKINPSLAFGWLGFAVPVWVLLIGLPQFTTARQMSRRAGFMGLLAGTMFSILLLLTDAYYLKMLGTASPRAGELIWMVTGLRLGGELSGGGLGIDPATVPARLWEVMAWVGWRDPATTWVVQLLPGSSHFKAPWMASLSRSILLSVLGIYILIMVISRGGKRQLPLFPALVQVSLFVGVAIAWYLATVLLLTVGHGTLEASLLSTYTHKFIDLLAMFVLPLHWTLCFAMLVCVTSFLLPERVWDSVLSRRMSTIVGSIILMVSVFFIFMHPPVGPDLASLGWSLPVSEAEVDEFQDLEAKLPKGVTVIVPAMPAMLNGREDWILPEARESVYLPFARRSYLFNVRLGDGYVLDAKDLRQNFCDGNIERARAFLRIHGVDYVFAVTVPGDKSQILDRLYCGVTYRDMGVTVDGAILGGDGIGFYRIISTQQE